MQRLSGSGAAVELQCDVLMHNFSISSNAMTQQRGRLQRHSQNDLGKKVKLQKFKRTSGGISKAGGVRVNTKSVYVSAAVSPPTFRVSVKQ